MVDFKFRLFNREPKKTEQIETGDWITVSGDCMNPVYRNGDILTSDVIVTEEPNEGDFGSVRIRKDGKLMQRLAIWGPLKGDRRVILSFSKGSGHDEVDEINVNEFEHMRVKKTMTPHSYKTLLKKLLG